MQGLPPLQPSEGDRDGSVVPVTISPVPTCAVNPNHFPGSSRLSRLRTVMCGAGRPRRGSTATDSYRAACRRLQGPAPARDPSVPGGRRMGNGVLQLQGNTFLSTPSRFRLPPALARCQHLRGRGGLEAQGLLRILVPNLDSEDGQYQPESHRTREYVYCRAWHPMVQLTHRG